MKETDGNEEKAPSVNVPVSEDVRKELAFRPLCILSICEIILGILSIIAGAALLQNDLKIDWRQYCNSDYNYYCVSTLSLWGFGIWCGLFVIATGCVGIYGIVQKSMCNNVAVMTTSFSVAPFALAQFVTGIVCIIEHTKPLPSKGSYRDSWNRQHITYATPYISNRATSISLDVVIALAGLAELVAVVLSAVYSACATCCERSPAYLTFDQDPDEFQDVGMQRPMMYGNQMPGSHMQAQPFILVPYNQAVSGEYQPTLMAYGGYPSNPSNVPPVDSQQLPPSEATET